MKNISQNGMTAVSLKQQESKLKLLLARCKNNSSFIAKRKAGEYNKDLGLPQKIALLNPLLFI